jgi:hypothetical protein
MYKRALYSGLSFRKTDHERNSLMTKAGEEKRKKANLMAGYL